MLKGLALATFVAPLVGRTEIRAAEQAEKKDNVEYLFVHSAHATFSRDGMLKLCGIVLDC